MAREYDHLFKLLIIGDSGKNAPQSGAGRGFAGSSRYQGVVTVYHTLNPVSNHERTLELVFLRKAVLYE